ncbi:MAG: cupin domain-containing protein [Methanobacteriaceae archaeon]|nr:cupin domain-containing protein [Methanobacteriaceae archaeon]
MLIKDIKTCENFKGLDETIICELLHPKNESEHLKMGFSLAYAALDSGKSSIPHRIKDSVEVYYILEGRGLMHIDQESNVLKEGQAVYIPPGSVQYIENIGNSKLKFLCIVSPPWELDNEEIV